MSAKQILLMILIILMLIVFIQNTEVITFSFLFWDWSISKILLLPLVTLVGLTVGFLAYPILIKKIGKDKVTQPR